MDSLNVQDIRSVCVFNISPSANEKTVTDFFSFCGRITQLLLKKEDGKDTSAAIIEFETESAAKTALLLTNALIVDRPITVSPFVGTATPAIAPQTTVVVDQSKITQRDFGNVPDENRSKTSVIASLLAAGYSLANDALEDAKEYDEKHNISLRAKVAVDQFLVKAHEIDVQYGISEKAAAAKNTVVEKTKPVVEKAKQVDSEYKISEKASQAATTVKTTAQTAASKIAENPTVKKGIDAVKQTTQKVATSVNQTFNDVREQTREAIEEKKRERAASGSAPAAIAASAPAPADTVAATDNVTGAATPSTNTAPQQ